MFRLEFMARNRFRVGFLSWGVFLAGLLACLSSAQGQDWTQIGSLPDGVTSGFFFDTQSGFVGCSSAPYLFKTTNGGVTWTQIILPPDVRVPGGEITSIYMSDRANGWF